MLDTVLRAALATPWAARTTHSLAQKGVNFQHGTLSQTLPLGLGDAGNARKTTTLSLSPRHAGRHVAADPPPPREVAPPPQHAHYHPIKTLLLLGGRAGTPQTPPSSLSE